MVIARETTGQQQLRQQLHEPRLREEGPVQGGLREPGRVPAGPADRPRAGVQLGPHADPEAPPGERGAGLGSHHPLRHLRTALAGRQPDGPLCPAAPVGQGGLPRERLQQLRGLQALRGRLVRQALEAQFPSRRQVRRSPARQLLRLRHVQAGPAPGLRPLQGGEGPGSRQREPLHDAPRAGGPGKDGGPQGTGDPALSLVRERPRPDAGGPHAAGVSAEFPRGHPQGQVLERLVRGRGRHRAGGLPGPGAKKKAGFIHIQYSEAFDKVAKEVSIGYAQRLRGGVERFGVLPASHQRDRGGARAGDQTRRRRSERRRREAARRRLQVAADAHPGLARGFRLEEARGVHGPGGQLRQRLGRLRGLHRPAGRVAEATGQEGEAGQRAGAGRSRTGPSSTVRRRVTLPFKGGKVRPGARPYIYNDATGDWDPVYLPAGSKPVRYDAAAGTASFDVQVFGVFALAVPR